MAGAAAHPGGVPGNGTRPDADVQVRRPAWLGLRRQSLYVFVCSRLEQDELLARLEQDYLSPPYTSCAPPVSSLPSVISCRLRHQYGSAPDHLLYVAYFLPTSINAAWLSVAAAVQLLIALHGSQRQDDLQVAAVLLAALVAAGGA